VLVAVRRYYLSKGSFARRLRGSSPDRQDRQIPQLAQPRMRCDRTRRIGARDQQAAQGRFRDRLSISFDA